MRLTFITRVLLIVATGLVSIGLIGIVPVGRPSASPSHLMIIIDEAGSGAPADLDCPSERRDARTLYSDTILTEGRP
jgi:hypothetical protein